MKISPSQLQAVSLKEAADRLYQAGQSLQGRNLRRGSWLEIAQVIQGRGHLSGIVLARLQAAHTRADALRVLRIVRRAAGQKKSGQNRRAGTAAAAPTVQTVLQAQAEEERWADYDWYDWNDEWEFDFNPFAGTDYDYQEWRAEQNLEFSASNLPVPGLRPVSPLQTFIAEYAYARRKAGQESPTSLGRAVGPAAYQRLLTLVSADPQPLAAQFSDAERAFLSQYQLTRLLDFIDRPQPFLDTPPAPVTTGPELAGLTLIEERADHPFSIDWASAAAWLLDKLAQPPAADYEVVVRGFYKLAAAAPADLLAHSLSAANRLHPAWATLLFYLWPRRHSLRPGEALPPPRYARLTWEDVLLSGLGSDLVLHHLRQNYADFFQGSLRVNPALADKALNLLLAGAGTLRWMAYPAFTLTCRSGVSLVGLKTFTEMVNLALELQRWHYDLLNQGVAAIVSQVSDQSQAMRAITLPETTRQEIAATFETHVIAYVLLKARVLQAQLAQAPFRLRRKHIRRFWADYAAAQLGDLSVPTTLAALRPTYSPDLIKEGLAHALLDYLQHDWAFTADQRIVLKEEFIGVLRHLALTYTLEPPLYSWPTPPTEADLDRTGELADFLLKQFKHAPLELAQALVIPPGQGLPLLNGGQETTAERTFRRLLREVTGSATTRPDDSPPQIFTCRPITKTAALERGALGGDCSSQSVPLRALSPHHVYYGIFETDTPQRGYMTVFEAWAETEAGLRRPVLCLETINVPLKSFNAVQQDLLLIFEAIAHSRGLHPQLVLITGIGTWNYQNGEALRQSRRFRQGEAVHLTPADPVSWQLYQRLTLEAGYYNAFETAAAWASPHHRRPFRFLAPFEAEMDLVQPENLAEAQRLAALPPRQLIITARTDQGAAGFISELPVLLEKEG